MKSARKNYDADFKARVVLESFHHDITIEQISSKYGVAQSVINKWRKIFKDNLPFVFASAQPKKTQLKPEESPDYLKKIIGDLTVENDILKKALSVWD